MINNIFYICLILILIFGCGKPPAKNNPNELNYYLNTWNGVVYDRSAILYISSNNSINIVLLKDIPYCLKKSYIYIKSGSDLLFDNNFMDIDSYNDDSECFGVVDLFKINKQNEYVYVYINENILIFKKEL